jgi:hypothetical protein
MRRRDRDGTDPAVGRVAHDVVCCRLQPTSDVRVMLVDASGRAIASIDLSASDTRALRDALTGVLRVTGDGR